MLTDARGLVLTTGHAAAAQASDRAVHALLAHRGDLLAHLSDSLAADPELVLAHALAGFAWRTQARAEFLPRAGAHLQAARHALAERGGTARERGLVAALAAWHEAGDMTQAATQLDQLVRAEPHDAVALKLAHGLRFMLGDAPGMRLATEAALPAWNEGVPGFGYVLGCHAFALEETGDAAGAERIGRQGCALAADDLWGAHAVAHVMERQGRATDGLAWIDAIGFRLREGGAFGRHVRWHAALFHLHLGDTSAALDLHDRFVAAEPPEDVRDFANAASLLWRLQAQGARVGQTRWKVLAGIAARQAAHGANTASLAFFDLHQVLALAEAGAHGALAAKLEAMRLRALIGTDCQARVTAASGLSAAHGLAAAASGQDDDAVALLLPLRPRLRALGGSDAQRDLLDRVLIDAALSAGRHGTARALLRDRARARASGAWEALCRARLEQEVGQGPAPLRMARAG